MPLYEGVANWLPTPEGEDQSVRPVSTEAVSKLREIFRSAARSEDFHNFSVLRLWTVSGLEKANEIGPCENVLEFSHGLDP